MNENKIAVVFDWESTLTTCEIMPEIAKSLDDSLFEQLSKEQERRIKGEVPWKESYEKTIHMLVDFGLTKQQISNLVNTVLKIKPGVMELLQFLQNNNIPTAIISGGSKDFVPQAYRKLVKIYANEFLYTPDGNLSGVKINIDGNKQDFLQIFCNEIGIPLTDVVAVGDGASDLGMMKIAGFSIAVKNAKPIVKEKAKCVMNNDDMKILIGIIESRRR